MSAQPTSRTDDAAPGAVARVLSWLRAGYPTGVPRGDYVALLGHSASGDSALVYDLVANRLVGQRLLGPAGSVDWVAMSQSGDAVLVSFFADGPGSEQGVAVYDRSMRPVRHLTDSENGVGQVRKTVPGHHRCRGEVPAGRDEGPSVKGAWWWTIPT